MSGQHDFMGPGEDATPDNGEAEAHVGPIPEGEMPGLTPDRRRQTLELPVVNVREITDGPESGELRRLYRTGTDRDAMSPVMVTGSESPEARLDRSAVDTQRERIIDPVQDDAGPQSDQA